MVQCWCAVVVFCLPAPALAVNTVSVAETSRVVTDENLLPGTPRSTWEPSGSSATIRGFADSISVNIGQPVTFYVQSLGATNISFDLVVYRLGYYQGNGAREVARFSGVTVEQPNCTVTPTPSLDPTTDAKEFPHLIDCGNWNPTWTWVTPTNVPSGLFLAKVKRRDTGSSCGIFFVVRDDGRHSDIILQTSDTTWQAYNYGPAYQGGVVLPDQFMDGHSVYDGYNRRAYKVSYRRPMLWAVTNSSPSGGLVSADTTYSILIYRGEELSMIRFLEGNGFDVAYTTGRDSDQRGELIKNHRLFISSGHDEYWSLRQMENVRAARDAGVNLAIFSGNTAYWKIRWEDNYHTMVVFKERRGKKLDPLPGVTTGLFRDPSFGPPNYDGYWPENALLGLLGSQIDNVEHNLHVPERDGKLRFWRNTSVAELLPGETASFTNLLGYEVDSPVDNGFSPPGLFHVSTTEIDNQEPGTTSFEFGRASIKHHLSLYRASSGALVFHAGTMRLQRALGGYFNRVLGPVDRRIQQAMLNLFADMNVQPAVPQAGLVLASRTTDSTAPSAQVIFPTQGAIANALDTLVVSGVATDDGGRVAAIEVSTDYGSTWHPADGHESWTYTFTPCSPGDYGILARAVDDSGNIGLPSAVRTITAATADVNDFVVNGAFDCGFESVPQVGPTAELGYGWAVRKKSSSPLSLTRGGQIAGINLQRVLAGASGDGIGQDLVLVPGGEYVLKARVFVESGSVSLRIGRRNFASDVQVMVTETGRWRSVSASYSPVQNACEFQICSEGGAATFKLDDVRLTLVSASPFNNLPTITGIGPQTVSEDGVVGPIAFSVSDLETAAGSLSLAATSSNVSLVPVGRVVFGGSGGNRTVTVTPVSNRSGTARVTITVTDGGGAETSTSFDVTVIEGNDSPTITGIEPQTVSEDGVVGPIAFSVSDLETAAGSLSLAATSSNVSLVPVGRVVFGGSGGNRTVTVTPVSNRSGTARVTITVTDGGGADTSTSFDVTVIEGNDSPTITGIEPQTVSEDGVVGPIAFSVSDLETAAGSLSLAATSSNVSLVPVGRVVFGGSGGNRTVTVTPVSNRSGTARVTITVTDGGGADTSTSFDVTVIEGNDSPTITGIEPQTVSEDGVVGPIAFSVSDLETAAGSLSLAATSSNVSLVPVGRVVFGGSGGNRTVTVTPVSNRSGTARVTITVTDGGGADTSTSFDVTVIEGNDSPTITGIGPQTVSEDGVVGPIAFSVSDLETAAGSLSLAATSSNVSLVPVGRVVFGGSGGNRTVTVTPVSNRSGTARVTITVTDGGGAETSTSFDVTVIEGNDSPTITGIEPQTVSEDGVVGPIAFSVSDLETAAGSLSLAATSSNVSLVPVGRVVFGGSGGNRTVTVTPVSNRSGTARVTITVTDGGGAETSTSFDVTVIEENDPPTISDIGPQIVSKEGVVGPVSFSIADVETPVKKLTLSATSSNPALVPIRNVVLQGNGSERTVTVTPVSNRSGVARVTITLSDGDDTVTSPSFTINVVATDSIVEENLIPGTPQETWEPRDGFPNIRGFTSDISVNKGEPITFYVQSLDAPNVPYGIVVYRLGYYQGKGAREVARFDGVTVEQPPCLTSPTPSLDPATDAQQFPFLIDCGNWLPSWTWYTPGNSMSGLFMAKIQRRDSQVSCGVFFVIRDDARGADILLQTSDTTWQAYNHGPAYQGEGIPSELQMDGHSVYDSLSPRAYKVSYRRPHLWVLTNAAPPHAQIIGDTTYGAVLSFGEEYPMIRFLEANGYDVAYTTGKDSDRRGELIRNHRLFMTSGHDEYWSLKQRLHIEAARDAGVNLAFFSGNSAFWKIRWEDDHQTMVVFKEANGLKLDPMPGVTTGLFRDPTFAAPAFDGYLPENALNGVLTSRATYVEYDLWVPEEDGKLRFWRNTEVAKLQPRQVASFEDLLGYELDSPVDNGFSPPGLFYLSTTDVNNQRVSSFELGRSSVRHHLTLYRASSGALVFHAGTMRLQRALASSYKTASESGDPRMQQAIINLFADMHVQPASIQSGLARAEPSTDTSPPSAFVSSPRNGSCARVFDRVIVSGTATDVGGRVAAVEVSTDEGATWHPATGRENWTYVFTPNSLGVHSIRARGVDDSGNLGSPSLTHFLNADVARVNDFIVNGSFDGRFVVLDNSSGVGELGQGWFARAVSGPPVAVSRGARIPGVNLQRVVAQKAGDGIGQHLSLAVGREYLVEARVFVESGSVTVKIVQGLNKAGLQLVAPATGSWQVLSSVYVPTETINSFIVCSEGGAATFKVDDVGLMLRDEEPLELSLSFLSEEVLQLDMFGLPGSKCCVETSTNLLNWEFMFLGGNLDGRSTYPVPYSPINPLRFFRAALP
jgi:hypothetical protein